jgi:hypothetical protein
MAVVFSDQFQDICEGRLGITKESVTEAILQPDKEQRVQSQGLTITMYSKKAAGLLVITHLAGDQQVVDLAFRIRENLPEKTAVPLQIVKALAQKTGLEIRIGERQARFIYNEIVPSSDADLKKAIRVDNPENHATASLIWARSRQNNMGPMVQCAMAFCIDLDAYEKWLAGS